MSKKEFSIARILKSPVRILIKARDAYVRTMVSWTAAIDAAGIHHAVGFGAPSGNFYSGAGMVRRGFSVVGPALESKADEDVRELVRAASALARSPTAEERRYPPLDQRRRCRRIVMERLDEEKPCEFQRVISCDSGRKGGHFRKCR